MQHSRASSGGFRGGRAGAAAPFLPLGDGLTTSLTVLLICDNGTVLHYGDTIACVSLQTRKTWYSEYAK